MRYMAVLPETCCMNKPRLTALDDLNGPAVQPGYSPENHGLGIVHLGPGAFHRAHQAVMTDDALAAHGGDWRIAGVSLRSKDTASCLNAQNGLYTLLERGATTATARVIASIDHIIATDTQAALDLLCSPSIRIVTLTVTEAGYGIDRESRLPDTNNSNVVADLGVDLTNPAQPTSVLGLLVTAIVRRRQAGSKPFAVLSCDNLPENGTLLRDGVIGFARLAVDQELANWISENIAFPCSMVDRITPAPTDETRHEATRQTGCHDLAAVETEPFIQWIIEDNFPSGRPQWEAGGALLVDDVTPYERMKLMMLNGSHSMLAYAGYLTGQKFVRDVMRDPDLSNLVQRHFSAAAKLLGPLPGVDFKDYAAALKMRFINPSIAHETYQIATDGTQKLPQRIFQPAIEAIENKQNVRPFAFATAMWMRYCLQRDDDGNHYELRDARSEEIVNVVAGTNSSAVALSKALHAVPQFIPQQLANNRDWQESITEILAMTLEKGCSETIAHETTLTL